MNHKRPPLPAIIIVALLIIVSAYFIITQAMAEKNGALTASGTIEAVQVNLAPELAGKVTEVFAEEGQSVSMNDPLLRLDPSLLTAQREVASTQVNFAKAALAAAQLKYDQALETAIAAQNAQRAKDLRSSTPSDFDQPAWYFDQTEQLDSAKIELDNAQADLDVEAQNLKTVISDLHNSEYLKAEKRLADARAAFLVADAVKRQADGTPNSGGLLDAANDYREIAQTELEDAQKEYDDLLNTEEADDIEYARGQLIIAQQRYYSAYERWLGLQTGAESPAVLAALKSLEQAKVAVSQAEANLVLLDTQLAKLNITAPMDGVILTRNVEPGEFVQPGSTAFVLGQLSELTITVYVPEDRYGELSIGQAADVTVDSFPDVIFTATVLQIADKAEFTPRNVQTVQGRSSTVFAIKLKVDDPDGKLKPGMPADVVFK